MFFTNLGRFIVRRRRPILSLTVLFIVVAGALGAGAFGALKGGGFEDPDAESTRAHDLLETQFNAGDPNLVLLVNARSGDVDDPAAAEAGRQLTDQLLRIPGMVQVVSYWALDDGGDLRSEKGDKAIVLARITGTDEEVTEGYDLVEAELSGDRGAIDVQLGGATAVDHALDEEIGGDLAKAEAISVPVTLVLLVLVFGGLIAAGLPLLVALQSLAGTFLSLFLIGSITDVSIYSINLTTALGLGLAIDYSLFIVTRYREELGRGLAPHDAVVRTVETAGKTVAFSAFVVAASLSALLVFPLFFLRSFAYAGISVVLVAAAGSIISLSALLAVLGTRVNRLSFRRVAPAAMGTGFWHRLAHGVMKRPVVTAVGTIALLLFLGAPFLRVEFGLPTTDALPSSSVARQVSEQLDEEFASNGSESFAIVAADVATADVTAIAAYASEVSGLDGVARVDTSTGSYQGGQQVAEPGPRSATFASGTNGVYFTVTPSIAPRSGAGEELVRQIRSIQPGFDTGVQGSAAQLLDTKAAIADSLPLAIGIIALITFVLLFLVFGSILVPIKAIVLNLLSLTATFGAMVWIFQDGNGSDLLGFTANGNLDVSMPILMFCVAFGLSMDYEVFLLSRIKEEYDRTGDNTQAVAAGLERTGRIVTAAAGLLAVTFLAFATSGVTFIKLFGLGLALAVVMDATIIRGLLVPAFMRLAGDANWWAPQWMKRIHTRIGIHEGDAAVADRNDIDRGDQDVHGAGGTRELVSVSD